MSKLKKDGERFLKSEARVIAFKQRVGKIVMQDVHFYNHLSMYPNLYKFSVPVTMMDAACNAPHWQHEKTRFIAELMVDAITIGKITEDQPFELSFDMLTDLTFSKIERRFQQFAGIPALPPIKLNIEPIEVREVVGDAISTTATLTSDDTVTDKIRSSLCSNPTVLDNAELIEEHDDKKTLENRLYGWKPQLIRQLIAPYLNCQDTFSLKRAYPEEEFSMPICDDFKYRERYHLETSDLKSDEKLSIRRERLCICSTKLYVAAFERDYVLIALQNEIIRRIARQQEVLNPHNVITNYLWRRNEKVLRSTIRISQERIFQLAKHGLSKCYIRHSRSSNWEETMTF